MQIGDWVAYHDYADVRRLAVVTDDQPDDTGRYDLMVLPPRNQPYSVQAPEGTKAGTWRKLEKPHGRR